MRTARRLSSARPVSSSKYSGFCNASVTNSMPRSRYSFLTMLEHAVLQNQRLRVRGDSRRARTKRGRADIPATECLRGEDHVAPVGKEATDLVRHVAQRGARCALCPASAARGRRRQPFGRVVAQIHEQLHAHRTCDKSAYQRSSGVPESSGLPDMGANPGRVTVHCWSSVRLLIESVGATTSLQK